MMSMIDYISKEQGIGNKIFLEKDLLLHKLLYEISNTQFLHDNLAFKGGTCLTKCYLGYYRFSEDLDFTWMDQNGYEHKSQKEIRRILSQRINVLLKHIKDIADRLHLDFNAEKSDSRYLEYGGSNRFVTLKLWYNSEILEKESFVKIQINFLEKMFYGFETHKARSVIANKKEFGFIYSGQKDDADRLMSDIDLHCYDIKEILIEKFRAILTRKAVKERDFIDIFIICKQKKLNYIDFRKQIIEKTEFMMGFEKYMTNIEKFNLVRITAQEEQKLMLIPLDKGFDAFYETLQGFLLDMAKEIKV